MKINKNKQKVRYNLSKKWKIKSNKMNNKSKKAIHLPFKERKTQKKKMGKIKTKMKKIKINNNKSKIKIQRNKNQNNNNKMKKI